MPELPEVETVRRGLAPVMEGARIAAVAQNRPDLRWPFPDRLKDRLEGKRVERLRRRSKYLLADLDSGEVLLIHLGMSGRMTVSGDPLGHFARAQAAPEKHDHMVITMENGTRIAFNDPRRFGAVDLFDASDEPRHRLIAHLGPEPLGNGFSGPALAVAFKGRKMPVKAALLDQRIVAGLGNIYVCEALHRAHIHPARAAGRIAPARLDALVQQIRAVLEDAIASGGSSLRDHRQASGELGYFQHSFRAYGREAAPCPTPNCPGTIRRIVQSGRSTFYCPTCQR